MQHLSGNEMNISFPHFFARLLVTMATPRRSPRLADKRIDYPKMGGDKKTKKKGRRGSSTSPATRCSLQFLSENSSDEVQLEPVEQLNIANFPIGRIQVKGQHPKHGGKVGTTQGRTTNFIRVLFETSEKTILISPRFLLQLNEGDDNLSSDETNESTTSTPTPRKSIIKTPRHSSIRVITPSRSTVRFNMERNCFASYEREDPPNVVTTEDSIINNCSSNSSNIVGHLPEEIDDDVTLRNEIALAEWDGFSDDDDDDDDEEEEEDGFFLYCQ